MEGVEGERIRVEKEVEVKRILDPLKPSEKEVENHNRTHMPYINWCPHCVRAKEKTWITGGRWKERGACLNIRSTTASRGTKWAIN